MKFLKISLYILTGVLLLLVIAGGVFVATFDANDYKPLIAEQVKQQTGRELMLDDIKPSIFPWLGIELQKISLSNANGFKAEKMIQITRLDVRVALMPLLMQEVRIDTLRLHGLSLFLEKDKNGKTNWDDILEKQDRSITEKSTKTREIKEADEQAPADPLAALLINGVEIKDATIGWNDALSGQNINIQNFNLNTGALRPGKALPMALSASVELSEPKTRIEMELKTRMHLDLKVQKIKLENLDVTVDAVLAQDDLKQFQLNLKTQIDADLNSQRFIMPAYTIEVNAQGKSLPGEALKASIDGDADIDLKKQTAGIKKLTVQALGLRLQSQLAVTNLSSSPGISGQFKLDSFDLKKLAKALAVELPVTKDKTVLKSASLNFNVMANEKNLKINMLKFMLDKTSVLADVKVQNFEKPEINYSMNIDQIDLDGYLPPDAKSVNNDKTKASKGGAETKADIPIELPVELLRSLDVEGVVSVGSLKLVDQLVSSLNIKTIAKQGVIKVPVLNATVLKGSVVSSAQIDVQKNTPRYRFKLTGNNLNTDTIVNPVLQDMLGEKSVSMSGVTDLNMNIKTRGQTVNQLISASNGRLAMNMSDATLHGVDVEYFVRKSVVDFLKQKKQKVPEGWRGEYSPKEKTALKVAKASAVIENGVIDNKDLLLESSRFKITGAGIINVPKEVLSYRVVIDVKPVKTESAGERLLDVPMPVFVKGAFSQPEISIDSKIWLKSVGKELKAEVKKEIKKKLKTEKKEQKKEIKKKLKDKFKGLFR